MQSKEQRRLIRLAGAINQKARRIGAHGLISAEDLAMVILRQPTCAYCGTELELGQGSFDHQLPYERGGQNMPSNITRVCWKCQRSKFTMTPTEWIAFQQVMVRCKVCNKEFKPRHGEWARGKATTCSHRCAARLRWMGRSA